MRSKFPLFQSHLDLAHTYWAQLLKAGDSVLDATCGNGHDSAVLGELVLCEGTGTLYLCDIQEQALKATRERLKSDWLPRCHFHCCCHSGLAEHIAANSLKGVVYNLGYLPGADKELTTQTESTIDSLSQVLEWVQNGGFISITCYPGHDEGAAEEAALLEWCQGLSPKEWSVCHHRWVNRRKSPSLLFLQKSA